MDMDYTFSPLSGGYYEAYMFTGIIEAIGTIESVTHRTTHRAGLSHPGVRLAVRCNSVIPSTVAGDSLAIDGVCLTVEEAEGPVCRVFASQESLDSTTLGRKRRGDKVNLERPLSIDGRLGGHIVSGHVDGVGYIQSIAHHDETHIVTITFPPVLRHFTIAKGSICVDGISLTITTLHDDTFSVCIIPHTWKTTTVQWRKPGDSVNLECDLLAKYLYAWGNAPHATKKQSTGTGVTRQLLERTGFDR
jgi:riboflavin synthase